MRGCRVQALDDALLIDNDEEILMADDEANEQVPSSDHLVTGLRIRIDLMRIRVRIRIQHFF
jgi:hypothetical protein